MKKLDVEKVRGEITHHISPVIGWIRLNPDNQSNLEAYLDRAKQAAEAIVKMSEDDTVLEYCVLEARSDSTHRTEMSMWSPDRELAKNIAEMFAKGEKYGNDMRAKAGLGVYSYEVVSRPKATKPTVLEVY